MPQKKLEIRKNPNFLNYYQIFKWNQNKLLGGCDFIIYKNNFFLDYIICAQQQNYCYNIE